MAYVISGILIAVCLGSLFTNKLDQGIDFVGGRTYQVRFADAALHADGRRPRADPLVQTGVTGRAGRPQYFTLQP